MHVCRLAAASARNPALIVMSLPPEIHTTLVSTLMFEVTALQYFSGTLFGYAQQNVVVGDVPFV